MKRFISYGKIKGMDDVFKNVMHQTRFVGVEDGKAVYDNTLDLPTISAVATEKIHGTNAAVCYSEPDGFWVQSRKNIITPEKDNAGCAFAAMSNIAYWKDIIFDLAEEYNINLSENIISVYFEWAGGNIQKNACVSGYDKSAFIFQYFKVSPIEPQLNSENEEVSRWLETGCNYDGEFSWIWVDNVDVNIYNVMNFPHYNIEIDFMKPEISRNQLVDLVENTIEPESPLGKMLGLELMIGEGVVVTLEYKGTVHRFKVKGEKHANGSKIKKLKPIDEVKEQKKRDFVNKVACKPFRLDQMFTEIQNSKYNGDVNLMSKKDTGDYIRLIIKDVLAEEMSKFSEYGLEPKEVNGNISKVASSYFHQRLSDEVMGLC